MEGRALAVSYAFRMPPGPVRPKRPRPAYEPKGLSPGGHRGGPPSSRPLVARGPLPARDPWWPECPPRPWPLVARGRLPARGPWWFEGLLPTSAPALLNRRVSSSCRRVEAGEKARHRAACGLGSRGAVGPGRVASGTLEPLRGGLSRRRRRGGSLGGVREVGSEGAPREGVAAASE